MGAKRTSQLWVPPFLSYELWKQSYELWKIDDPNSLLVTVKLAGEISLG